LRNRWLDRKSASSPDFLVTNSFWNFVKVRSTTLDTWTPREIELIRSRGNEFGRNYYEACVPRDVVRPDANDTAAVEKWYAETNSQWCSDTPK